MTNDPARAVAGALSPARGGRTLSGYIRTRLRKQPRMTRTEMRASLRECMLLSWGTLGCQRFWRVLKQMAEAGEITLEGDDVIAVNLRHRVPRKQKPGPETVGAKRRRMREERDARAKTRQEAPRLGR